MKDMFDKAKHGDRIRIVRARIALSAQLMHAGTSHRFLGHMLTLRVTLSTQTLHAGPHIASLSLLN
jgi:hypothetical protein